MNRSDLTIPRTRLEMMSNAICYSIFLAVIAFLLLKWGELPDAVPFHFGLSGEADQYGSPATLLILPAVAVVVTILMEVLERHPQVHNYPSRLNEDNREAFYLNSRRMLNMTKNMTLIIFSIVILEILSVALEGSSLFGVAMLPLIFMLIGIPIIYGLIRRRQIK
ncbi:DUF1648 domain-containing protein [Salinicoccus sp. ID82-1]|uniref:DUF1648 domain-containing protein n=1 Tax=Salinicoccus sp. ID82-1 TaxID=2820269 RepID=UPI001F30CA8F|nr:DUF1648 domain-containing protein [Salinicoccus sp. ID82-1]MCG1010938.1 DUF1648 domain-containing protein [Salinicoccus sp. ID82-1]